MVYKSGQIFLPFCHNAGMWRTDGRTDAQTEFSSLDGVCIAWSTVKNRMQYILKSCSHKFTALHYMGVKCSNTYTMFLQISPYNTMLICSFKCLTEFFKMLVISHLKQLQRFFALLIQCFLKTIAQLLQLNYIVYIIRWQTLLHFIGISEALLTTS